MSKQNSTKNESVSVSKAMQDKANATAQSFYEAFYQAPEGSAGDLIAKAEAATDKVTSLMLATAKACKSDAEKFTAAINQAEKAILKEQHGIQYPSKEVPNWKQTKANIRAGLKGIEFPDGETRKLKAGDFATMYEFRKALNALRKDKKAAERAVNGEGQTEGTEAGEQAESSDKVADCLASRIRKLERLAHDATGNPEAIARLEDLLDEAIAQAGTIFDELTAEVIEREQEEKRKSA